MTKLWKAQNTDQASYVGVVEFEDPTNEGDYIYFEIVKTETHLVFGSSCMSDYWNLEIMQSILMFQMMKTCKN